MRSSFKAFNIYTYSNKERYGLDFSFRIYGNLSVALLKTVDKNLPGEWIRLALKHQHISTVTLGRRSEHCNLSKENSYDYWVLD